jgi:hypothetical protein
VSDIEKGAMSAQVAPLPGCQLASERIDVRNAGQQTGKVSLVLSGVILVGSV